MCDQGSIPDSLLSEGRGMVEAFAADLVSAGFDVDRMIDRTVCPVAQIPPKELTHHHLRSPEEEKPIFERLANSADHTILIAPETDGALTKRVEWTLAAGGQLLGPGHQVTALTTDKHQLAKHLVAAAVPVPKGVAVAAGSRLPHDFHYPAVLKPRDGAGSQHMHLLGHADPEMHVSFAARLEEHVEGQPISVGVLGGPGGITALPACRQLISQDGKFTYLGGSLPLSEQQADRGERLAMRAANACGDFRGYMGIDLILGTHADEDRVIEINPRLTTSYLLLRQVADQNLAASIVRWSLGQCPSPSFSSRKVTFALSHLTEVLA